MSELCTAKQPTLPIFEEIIEALSSAIAAMEDNSSSIYVKINQIRNQPEPSNESIKATASDTVTEQLWNCISKLREINYTLCKSKENLMGLVG